MNKTAALVLIFSVNLSAAAYAQPAAVPLPSQSQVDFVKECMRKNGVVLKEPAPGHQLVMTDGQKKIVGACSKIVAQDLMLDAAEK